VKMLPAFVLLLFSTTMLNLHVSFAFVFYRIYLSFFFFGLCF